MENLQRTTEHLNRVARRKTALERITAAVLPADKPLTLEVGCGHGHFLTAYTAAHPSELCIGLDLIAERIARGERKKKRAQLHNIQFLHASAEDFLATLPTTTRIEKIFILFPDPWPKRRHHKNRIIQPEFLDALAGFAIPSTRLYFRTDDVLYFAAARKTVTEHARWDSTTENWPFEHQTVFQQRAESYQSLIARPR